MARKNRQTANAITVKNKEKSFFFQTKMIKKSRTKSE